MSLTSSMLRNVMDLYIETLTGAAFELRVSPFETIMSVKAKIQRHEGIPISQQHLIWQTVELEDDYCLHDYSIHDGATLKLVLAMRGGPINTRRVPMEDPALREMAEYMEANRDELLDKLPGNRQVTLLVYRDGDQLNFFRVVDRGDGTLTPLSESLSGSSMYHLCDDDEDEDAGLLGKDKVEENDKTKEKMKIIRTKMENLTLNKAKVAATHKPHKPKKKHTVVPRPPSSGRPNSRTRLRHLSSAGKTSIQPLTLPNKLNPLPPVGQTIAAVGAPPSKPLVAPSLGKSLVAPSLSKKGITEESDNEESTSRLLTSSIISKDSFESAKLPLSRLPSVQEDHDSTHDNATISSPPLGTVQESQSLEALLKQAQLTGLRKEINELSQEIQDGSRPHTSSRKKDITLDSLKESLSLRPTTSTRGLDKLISANTLESNLGSPNTPPKDKSLDHLDRPTTSSKYSSSMDRKQGLVLESLSRAEARGLLRQASLERLGSSKISSYLHSASKSRAGFPLGSAGQGRISTPEGRMVSARLQRMSSREGRITPSRLPPVKQKKKSKRCYVCSKKTGLATSYQCRCGHNFCATHRYAEAHDCTFDYKSEGRKLLEQSNPVVTAPKLPKI